MAFLLSDHQLRQLKKGDWVWVEMISSGENMVKSSTVFHQQLCESPHEEEGCLVVGFEIPFEKTGTYYPQGISLRFWSDEPTPEEREELGW